MILKTATIWAAFIPIAILNGLLREKCLVPLLGQGKPMGDGKAHRGRISTIYNQGNKQG